MKVVKNINLFKDIILGVIIIKIQFLIQLISTGSCDAFGDQVILLIQNNDVLKIKFSVKVIGMYKEDYGKNAIFIISKGLANILQIKCLSSQEFINTLPIIFVSVCSLLSFSQVRSKEKFNQLYSILSFKQRFKRIIFKLNQGIHLFNQIIKAFQLDILNYFQLQAKFNIFKNISQISKLFFSCLAQQF
ncbi:unnamed protein product [Paramecium sonneborni]|uniref:Transmembrane protein n=1 Tax=Paramecium sonneborni TaxID=65129 RepID=A0A8S1Q6T0_9CILI|nr:unnamed protein product [Paramecium sonneborni]